MLFNAAAPPITLLKNFKSSSRKKEEGNIFSDFGLEVKKNLRMGDEREEVPDHPVFSTIKQN